MVCMARPWFERPAATNRQRKSSAFAIQFSKLFANVRRMPLNLSLYQPNTVQPARVSDELSMHRNTHIDSYEQPLTRRQKIAIVEGTPISTQEAVTMEDNEFVYEMFLKYGVKARNLNVAGVSPMALKVRGVRSPTLLRFLDFDALHLVDSSFCFSCISAFGATPIVEAFLITASDAVALAGSSAVNQLGLCTVRKTRLGPPFIEIIKLNTKP
jgi:hypothetical protein